MTEGVFVLSEKKAKKRNKKGKWGFWVIFLALFLAIIAAIVSITNSFSAVLVKICAAKVESFAMSAVNSSVSEAMNSGVKYSDIVTVPPIETFSLRYTIPESIRWRADM